MTGAADTWEEYLAARFPGYLLPESAAKSLSVDEARRFLEGLTGRRSTLDVLRAVSLMARRAAELQELVRGPLPQLVQNLPSRTERVRREWEGGFQGRLALAETQALHTLGRRTAFVTRTPRRDFDLPENIVARAACERLISVLTLLRVGRALPEGGWASGLRDCEGALRRVVAATALREVAPRRPTLADENAARSARHPAYHQLARWAAWLRDALDDDDPAQIARVVADGALVPLDEPTRFELACLVRLGDAIERELHERSLHWTIERSLVAAGRRDVLAFRHQGGTALKVFYNQAALPGGRTEEGARHYLGNTGRMRPDLTVVLEHRGQHRGAAIVECKASQNAEYILTGYHEAMLYRHEYAEHLFAWPRALLVTSGPVPGPPRVGDDVVASTWAAWPPPAVVGALVDAAQAVARST